MHKKQVIIASRNPVKVEAVKHGFHAFMTDQAFDFVSILGSSDVSDQPETDAETLHGARHRAENARATHPDADYWVGVEGGIERREDGTMEAFAWVSICTKTQKGESRSMSFQLPPRVGQLIDEGYELGKADDIVFNETETKKKGGAIGLLTGNLISRENLYVPAVIGALIPFVNEKLFRSASKENLERA